MKAASGAERKRANKAAAIVVACVVAFAAVYLGAIAALDRVAAANQAPDIDIEDAAEAPTDTFYVLLIGSDTRKGTALYTGKKTDHAQVDQHSDVMTLVRVDPKKYRISLLSIPRDTVIAGETDKINSALLDNDPAAVVDAVERLCGLRADYYMMTTFSTFANLVDAMGGIDVDVPADVSVGDPGTGSRITVKAGKNQHLDGAQALALARARHEYGDNQDVMRQSNVRAIEAAIIERALGISSIDQAEDLVAAVGEDVQTNMDLSMLGLSVVDFMQNAGKVKILSGSGPYEGGGPRDEDGQWVIEADEQAWEKTMDAFTRGKDPQSVVSLPEPAAGVLGEDDDGMQAGSSSASSASASSGSNSSSSKAGAKK